MFKPVKEAGIILAVALALAAGAYGLRGLVLPWLGSGPAGPSPDAGDQLYSPVPIEQAVDWFHTGEALLADARSLEAYNKKHIQGAVHLDPDSMDEWSEKMMSRFAPDQIIVTYCDGVQCGLSRNLAEKLTWIGFERVYYLTDGWARLQAQGLPLTSAGSVP